MDIGMLRTIVDLVLMAGFFWLGTHWRHKYPNLPKLEIGSVIRIDGEYYRLESREHASGGVMDISTVYTFIDMTSSEVNELKNRKLKGR